MQIYEMSVKLVNNYSRMLENTNENRIVVVHAQKDRFHEV